MYGNPYGQQVQPQQYVNIPYYQPQYQPQQQKPAPLMGRVVSSLEEITVGDVPNDGSVGSRLQTGRAYLASGGHLTALSPRFVTFQSSRGSRKCRKLTQFQRCLKRWTRL